MTPQHKNQVGQSGTAANGGEWAAHSRTTPDVTLGNFTDVQTDSVPGLTAAQLARVSFDPAELAELADLGPEVQHQVALNPAASTDTINRLARKTTADVTQFALLYRSDLDAAAVNHFAQSEDVAVRALARARREYVPTSVGDRVSAAVERLIHGRRPVTAG